MQLLYLAIFLTVMCLLVFLSHMVKVRAFSGIFMLVVAALWFFSSLTGHLNYKLSVAVPWGSVDVRFSSALYLLVFVAILVVYICEGIHETQNLIVLSLAFHVTMGLAQFFLGQQSLALFTDAGKTENYQAALMIFEPSYWRMFVSFVATAVDAFFAVLIFQALTNRLHKLPLGIIIFLSLVLTMILDSLIFVGGTRPETFLKTFGSHVTYKTALSAFVSLPFYFYLKWFRGLSNLDLRRGSFDIFKRIESLESELKEANDGLRNYAEKLEERVELRTTELKLANSELQDYIGELNETKARTEQEMRMAAHVQSAMLPGDTVSSGPWRAAVEFRPMVEVSGDFYDFYEADGELNGVGLFDVSGHGVSSGLITVLAKAVIKRFFRGGGDLKLGKILQGANENLVGEIDVTGNYITGILLRFKDEFVEYVNAAHTDLLHYSALRDRVRVVEHEESSWKGMFLGIAGMEGSFKQLKMKTSPGDVLVLYSDCLLEGRNEKGELYRAERIASSINSAEKKDAMSIKDEILKDFFFFTGTEKLRDDLTLIVLERK